MIELLVVIAIIGILAAMLFPVFARARESARKIQCVSNVKNIALAVQMYLTDYDAFSPEEHRQEVVDFFTGRVDEGWEQHFANVSNPYLSWPVILDEYIKNRDVWRCPSAKMLGGAVVIMPGYGDWFAYLAANWDAFNNLDPGLGAEMTFPTGWGGSITDSALQGPTGGQFTGSREDQVFVQAYSTGEQNFWDKKLSAIGDPSTTPVVADGGLHATFLSMGTMAYPDICCAECSGIFDIMWGGSPSSPCQVGNPGGCDQACFDAHAHYDWAASPELKKSTARHLGGVNLGYADGHAAWIASQALTGLTDQGKIHGVGWICDPATSAQGYAADCGDPSGMIFLHDKPIGWDGL